MLLENIVRKGGCLCICIVATNGVEDMDLVLDELLGSNFKRCMTRFNVSTLDAVFHVGELVRFRKERTGGVESPNPFRTVTNLFGTNVLP